MSDRPRFILRFWPTAATVVGLALLLSLGTWQFGRYLEKLDLEEQREARRDEAPLEIESLADFEERAEPYSKVVLRGQLDPDFTFLFKHRVHDGEPGYWLGGVLRFADGKGAALVNRGWVHREEARSIAQQPASTDTGHFMGMVHTPPEIVADKRMREKLDSGALDLRGEVTEWDTYDLEAITDALPMPTPTPPNIVVLGPEHTQHPYPVATYDYVTEPYLTSERHLGYAVFWYATGLALLGMYLANGFGYLGVPRRS